MYVAKHSGLSHHEIIIKLQGSVTSAHTWSPWKTGPAIHGAQPISKRGVEGLAARLGNRKFTDRNKLRWCRLRCRWWGYAGHK